MRLALATLAVSTALAARSPGQQNVLVLLADDLGVDSVGAYAEGTDLPATPNIDALASLGVLFRNAWANPVCSPTRAALLTGRYPFRTTVGTVLDPDNHGLPVNEWTIPELLDLDPSLGYEHACLGKWHLGDSTNGGLLAPNVAGFMHYAGSYGGITPQPGVPGQQAYFLWMKTTDGAQRVASTYNTTETVDDALAWIAAADGPWLCYVAFCAPHAPYHAPPPGLHTVALPAQPPAVQPRPYFKAMVEAMDSEIGRLLGGLGGRLDTTTVIFLGDNGTEPAVTVSPFNPAHAKATLYEGGLNVPLIVSGPLVQQPGRECTALVDSTDLFATVADLAGADLGTLLPAVTIDSVSLVPYLLDPTLPSQRATVFAEAFAPNEPPGTSPSETHRAIRDARYKLIRIDRAGLSLEEHLYDLLADPFERRDLLRVYQNPIPTFVADAYVRLSTELNALLSSP